MMVEEKVREFVKENFLIFDEDINLKDDDSFFDTGIVDSIGVQELVAFIENNFSFQVEDEEFVPNNLDSVAKVCRFIRKKRNGKE